jgi:cell shape-determining protein MreD
MSTPSPAVRILKEKAKAILAGVLSLAAGEALVLVTDSTVQDAVKHAVPLTWQPVIPVLFSAVIFGVVHQIPNAKALEAEAQSVFAIPAPPAATDLPLDSQA